MDNKIKQIFSLLRTEGKDNVRTIIGKKYNMSLDSVKNHWLLKGRVPKQHESEIINILEKELKKQIDEDKKILAK